MSIPAHDLLVGSHFVSSFESVLRACHGYVGSALLARRKTRRTDFAGHANVKDTQIWSIIALELVHGFLTIVNRSDVVALQSCQRSATEEDERKGNTLVVRKRVKMFLATWLSSKELGKE